MEVTLFHRPGKNLKAPSAKPLKDLTAIVSPHQLLSLNKRKTVVERIATLSMLETTRFESTCLNLIHNLINHCQSIPETSTSYFAAQGGLLDHALHRTEAALSLFREYVIQETEEGVWSEEQQLWGYALLSAGLLQGIGKLQLDYRVDLFDSNGQLLKQWCPLLENMPSIGSYYLLEFQQEGDDDFRRRLNLLLARMLMPASGFDWIVSNPAVLAVWLALLNEDAQSAGTLGAILIRANAIAIQRYFNELTVKGMSGRGGRLGRMATFVDGASESMMDRERAVGVEFIKWLTTMLESGKILINKAPLLMVPGGLLMSVEMFQWFVREHPEYKNWQAVQQGFLSLGLHEVASDGSVMTRFEQANTHQMHNGVVFTDYAVALPEQMKIHNLNTGSVSSISATELVHIAQMDHHQFNRQESSIAPGSLMHLAQSGQWQPANVVDSTLKSGKAYSG